MECTYSMEYELHYWWNMTHCCQIVRNNNFNSSCYNNNYGQISNTLRPLTLRATTHTQRQGDYDNMMIICAMCMVTVLDIYDQNNIFY